MFSVKAKKEKDLVQTSEETTRVNQIFPILKEMEQHITQVEELKKQILYPDAKDFFDMLYNKYKLDELKILVENYQESLNAIVKTKEMFEDKMSKINEKKKILNENIKKLEIVFNKIVNISKNLSSHPLSQNEDAKIIASEFFMQQKKLLTESYVKEQLKKGFSNKEKGFSEEGKKKLDEILLEKTKEMSEGLEKLEKPEEIDKLAKNVIEDGMSEFIRQQKKLIADKNISSIIDSLSAMELKIAMLKFENVSRDVVCTIEEGKIKKINDVFKIQDIMQKFKDIAKSIHGKVKEEEDAGKQIQLTEAASEVMIRVFKIFNRLHNELELKLDKTVFNEIKSNICNMMLNCSEKELDAAAYLAKIQEWLANKVEIRADFVTKIAKKAEFSKAAHVKNLYKEISAIVPKQNLLAGYGLLTITPMQQKQLEFSEKLFDLLEGKKLEQETCDKIIKNISKVCHKGRTIELFDEKRKEDFVKEQCGTLLVDGIIDKEIKCKMEVDLLKDLDIAMKEHEAMPSREKEQMRFYLTNKIRYEKVEKIVGKEETKKILEDKKLKEIDEVISKTFEKIKGELKAESNVNSSPSIKNFLDFK